MNKGGRKRDWSLGPEAFANLLKWIDDGTDSGGERYLEMRRRLVLFFDRKNCLNADELADETLNRVARRLEEEGLIVSESPSKYCYIVAKFVFLESLRVKESVPIDDYLRIEGGDDRSGARDSEEKERREVLLECLERCTGELDPQNRDVILRYYFGEERVKIDNRRSLAFELGISMNALTIRACRIRDKLEVCVKKCAG